MMTDKEIIAVVQAHLDGKKIECRSQRTNFNWKVVDTPYWDFSGSDYRVNPGPRVWWLNVYAGSALGSTRAVAYKTKADAESAAGYTRIECVRVVEAPE